MAMVDLGAPCGYAVSGVGSEKLAKEIGGVDVGQDAQAYEQWVHDTRCGQVAPECGARALFISEVVKPGQGDFGTLVASHEGSGSI